jgi:hypothetical protein
VNISLSNYKNETYYLSDYNDIIYNNRNNIEDTKYRYGSYIIYEANNKTK